MTNAGWAIMIGSLTVVWGTTIWAYVKLLSAPRQNGDE